MSWFLPGVQLPFLRVSIDWLTFDGSIAANTSGKIIAIVDSSAHCVYVRNTHDGSIVFVAGTPGYVGW